MSCWPARVHAGMALTLHMRVSMTASFESCLPEAVLVWRLNSTSQLVVAWERCYVGA